MATRLDPLVSEFETDDQARSHDLWFRAKVRDAMNSAKPRIPHDEAMARVDSCFWRRERRVLTVRWSDEAIHDLADIIDYVEERNPRAAERLHADIASTAEQLGERPYLYRPGRVPGTREAVIRPNYLIVYQVGESFVDVLRVLHAAREYA